MAAGTVRVKGLRELQGALRKVNKEAAKAVRDAIKEAAEPIRRRAEQLVVSEIGGVGTGWEAMRLGARSGSVYIAPGARRRGGSPRPQFGTLLYEEAMVPALDDLQAELISNVEDALDELGQSAGF